LPVDADVLEASEFEAVGVAELDDADEIDV